MRLMFGQQIQRQTAHISEDMFPSVSETDLRFLTGLELPRVCQCGRLDGCSSRHYVCWAAGRTTLPPDTACCMPDGCSSRHWTLRVLGCSVSVTARGSGGEHSS